MNIDGPASTRSQDVVLRQAFSRSDGVCVSSIGQSPEAPEEPSNIGVGKITKCTPLGSLHHAIILPAHPPHPPPPPPPPKKKTILKTQAPRLRRNWRLADRAMEQPHSALPIAAAVAAVYSAAALLFAHWSFSTTAVACALPLVLLASALAARAIRGDPATLKGIEVGLTERGLFHQAGDLIGGDRLNRPRFLLVAMPINHFGERVRWALDLIGAPYEEYTVGGLISAFLRGRSVPQLIDRKTCSLIGNSDECLATRLAKAQSALTEGGYQVIIIKLFLRDWSRATLPVICECCM